LIGTWAALALLSDAKTKLTSHEGIVLQSHGVFMVGGHGYGG
jgi:hypothetical protein